jgi:hypothetical protein
VTEQYIFPLQILKILKSTKSLRYVIVALTKAIVPVTNAFGTCKSSQWRSKCFCNFCKNNDYGTTCRAGVLAAVTSIYAVVGVGLFREEDFSTFGDFSSAMFTVSLSLLSAILSNERS